VNTWKDFLSKQFDHPVGVCFFYNKNRLQLEDNLGLKGFCLHALDINPHVDRYVRDFRSVSHSPWGLKSGPNFQFPTMLNSMYEIHNNRWTLLLESDVYLIQENSAFPVEFFTEKEEAWVIGAKNIDTVSQLISFDTWNHINGAAFYCTGDREFINFLNSVWIPTLLIGLKSQVNLPFDTLTDFDSLTFLDSGTRSKWIYEMRRFKTIDNYINASNLKLDKRMINYFLTHWNGQEKANISALHIKTDWRTLDRFIQEYKRNTRKYDDDRTKSFA
jgi:hypothetical protein